MRSMHPSGARSVPGIVALAAILILFLVGRLPSASGSEKEQIASRYKFTEMPIAMPPGYRPVQMPMPDPQPATYNPNSLWRTGSRAFFKDQRAHQVGDILTMTVNITDKAQIANETQRSRVEAEDSGVRKPGVRGSVFAAGPLTKSDSQGA